MSVRCVLIDDDPTGAQLSAGVGVVARLEPGAVACAPAGVTALHLLTNARALDPGGARRVTLAAARLARAEAPGALVALRGDSTLRAHVREEYEAAAEALGEAAPALLLVPALPSAGRVTLGGTQLLLRDGAAVPLDRTEYARDPLFAYRSARLANWADERSGGLFARADAVEVPLAAVRRGGGAAVAEALARTASRGRPAVCVPDAETEADIGLVADGLRSAVAAGTPVVARGSPAFAALLAGARAAGDAAPPEGPGGVLVVCGSHVPSTTRQLERLVRAHPGALVEADARALARGGAEAEARHVAAAAQDRVERDGLAVIATPRVLVDVGAGAGLRIARGLARAVSLVSAPLRALVAKGGITSAVVLVDGLRAPGATVVGPLGPGVSLWRPVGGRRDVPLLVFPGNVGHDAALELLVERLGVRPVRSRVGA